ncbi:MAG TPA: IMP dehydrogenase [Patescibacteria group bacterium]
MSNSSFAPPRLPAFEDFLKDQILAEEYVSNKISYLRKKSSWSWLLKEYERESQASYLDSEKKRQVITQYNESYPSQGLISTCYDAHGYQNCEVERVADGLLEQTLHAWVYYLELFNHPDRVEALRRISKSTFVPPARPRKAHPVFEAARKNRHAIAISELALTVQGSDKVRTKRTERFKNGPFVKIGRQARSIFFGSANPDIWGSVPAVASMAQAHCLAGIPRDGFFTDPYRQVDFAVKVFEWLEKSPVLEGRTAADVKFLLDNWRHNVVGVLEAQPEKALKRVQLLYEVGVRTFRIYSPEPGTGALVTLKKIREYQKKAKWEPVEIFVGQIVDLAQARALERAGATGLYIGIGGGGRCITGKRSGVAIDWPSLVWELRGKTKLPLIIEGGASDYIPQTLALGASGIGVTRSVGGATIESPGGLLYFKDPHKQRLFKPYRGEASAGMKFMGGRSGPFGIIPYVEGEATITWIEYGRDNTPTILQKLYLLMGDAVLGMVFQNVSSIRELQQIGLTSLQKVTPAELDLRLPH